ncbi:hypothetical protein U1Q18_000579 [Sarracenia purpurea var. burkii]
MDVWQPHDWLAVMPCFGCSGVGYWFMVLCCCAGFPCEVGFGFGISLCCLVLDIAVMGHLLAYAWVAVNGLLQAIVVSPMAQWEQVADIFWHAHSCSWLGEFCKVELILLLTLEWSCHESSSPASVSSLFSWSFGS